MSWDIIIQNLPKDVQNIADIPDDFQPRPLGARTEVIARIQKVLPDVDFSDPSWGILEQSGFSIEFNMGDEATCDSVMLHVRGGGDAVATIARLLQHLQLRGIDCQSGEFFSVEAAQSSFGEWQTYRDRVTGQEGSSDESHDSAT